MAGSRAGIAYGVTVAPAGYTRWLQTRRLGNACEGTKHQFRGHGMRYRCDARGTLAVAGLPNWEHCWQLFRIPCYGRSCRQSPFETIGGGLEPLNLHLSGGAVEVIRPDPSAERCQEHLRRRTSPNDRRKCLNRGSRRKDETVAPGIYRTQLWRGTRERDLRRSAAEFDVRRRPIGHQQIDSDGPDR